MSGRRKQSAPAPPRIRPELILYDTGRRDVIDGKPVRILGLKYDLKNKNPVNYNVKKKTIDKE